MGIYTLHSYKYKGFRLRVRNNVLEGKVRLTVLLSLQCDIEITS